MSIQTKGGYICDEHFTEYRSCCLLIISCKNKGNKKIQIATQLVQGALWTLLAVDNWQDGHLITLIVYVVIIVLSFAGVVHLVVKK